MKRFLLRLFFYILPLLCIAVIAEIFIRSLPNMYKNKAKWMEINGNRVETMILGNSCPNRAINPSKLHNAFNLAMDNQRLEYDYFLLNKYVDKTPSLKTVILGVDLGNLFAKPFEKNGGKDWNKPIEYTLYMGFPKYGYFSKYHYELSCPIQSVYKIQNGFLSIIRDEPLFIGCDSLGWGGPVAQKRMNKKNKKKMEDDDIKLIMRDKFDIDIPTYLENINYVENIIRLCQNHHIRIILISTPYWYKFNKYLDRQVIELYNDAIVGICKKYKVEYKDYREDVRISMNNDFFYNPQHLCPQGANFFTDVFKKDFHIN